MRCGGREDNTALSGQSEKRGISRAKTFEFRALEKAAGNDPELILLDWRLPGISGTEVYRRLKADPNLKHIPVIFLTASREHAELEKLKVDTGEANIVTKPYEFKDLLVRVKEILGE